MKKYFRFFGLALLAAGMFAFTACGDDDESKEDVLVAVDGVTVTFGDYTWSANYFEGATTRQTSGLTSGRYFAIYATPNQSIGNIPIMKDGEQVGSAYCTYPMLYVMGEAKKGISSSDEMYIQYYEKDENTYAFEDEEDETWDLYGWENDENMKVSVTDWNSSTFVISGTVKGTLYEINDEGSHTGVTKDLSVVFKNITLEDLDAED